MKPLQYALKKEWHNLILLLIPFLILPFIWDQMPQQIATHWNFQGEPNGYSSKTVGLLIIPIINICLYFLLIYLPQIDPKKQIEIDQKPIPVLRTLLVIFLLAVHAWVIAFALGVARQSQSWIYLGLGAFFLVMGNYLRTLKPNYFIGIRVPWALEDAENWRQTHRVGSYTWVTGGLLMIILFPFYDTPRFGTIFGIIAAALAVIPAGYSFYYYKTRQ